ncbi:MAG: AAA family ATPase [Burkholderiales bacterium]|nr:AAA family ATPase [Burkholderiales bacterium]
MGVLDDPADALLAVQESLVRRLAGHLQSDEGGPVELLQTHISHVLLTPRHAYKIKKAADLGFVDFRALSSRRWACEEELRLNRRTAPQLYQDVVGIGDEGQLLPLALEPKHDGAPRAKEYAVRMRRFAPGARLDELLAAGRLTPGLADELADAIVDFHARIAVVREGGFGTPDDVRRASGENVAQLINLARDPDERAVIQRYSQWNDREEARLGALFSARHDGGFVRDGHGDLHLANVCLVDSRVTLFDCLEFNRHLRCVDVINDLAFLIMDLHARGASVLAWRVLNRYLEATGDYAAVPLLRYYVGYRAAVRLKVARLTDHAVSGGAAPGDDPGRCYVDLLRVMTKPFKRGIIISHGLAASGKTALTQHLIEQWGAIRLRSDVERKRLHGLSALDRPDASRVAQLYAPEASEKTYAELAKLAEGIARAGYFAVVDATFLKHAQRERFREVADRADIPFAIVHCEAPEALLRERMELRRAAADDASDADLRVLNRQISEQEALLPTECAQAMFCDASLPLSHWACPQAWQPLADKINGWPDV